MELLTEGLDFWLEKLSCLAVTVLDELSLEFLTTPGNSFSKDSFIVSDILAKCFLFEEVNALLSYLLVRFLQYFLVHAFFCLGKRSFHVSNIELNTFLDCSVALVLAHVRPGILNVWHRSFIYRGCVSLCKL